MDGTRHGLALLASHGAIWLWRYKLIPPNVSVEVVARPPCFYHHSAKLTVDATWWSHIRVPVVAGFTDFRRLLWVLELDAILSALSGGALAGNGTWYMHQAPENVEFLKRRAKPPHLRP